MVLVVSLDGKGGGTVLRERVWSRPRNLDVQGACIPVARWGGYKRSQPDGLVRFGSPGAIDRDAFGGLRQ